MLRLSLVSSLVFAASSLSALSLVDFKTCISSSPGIFSGYSQRTLDANTYLISSSSDTIVVGRSNITVAGYPSDPTQVSLRRNSSDPANMMYVDNSVSGVTITGFQFDGNNESPTSNTVDLELNAGGSTSSIYVINCQFQGSYTYYRGAYPHYSVSATNSTGVHYNTFNFAGLFSIKGISSVWAEYDNWDAAIGSVISLENTSDDHIEFQTIDYIYTGFPLFGDVPAGSIVIDAASSYIYLVQNTLDGGRLAAASDPNNPTNLDLNMSGVEGYGSYHYYYGNSFSNFSGPGISEVGTSHITLDVNGTVVNTANGNGYGTTSDTYSGVDIRNAANVSSCVSTVTANQVTAQSNSAYGLKIWNWNSTSCGNITGVSVTNGNFCSNTLTSASSGVYFDSSVSSPYTSGNTCQ